METLVWIIVALVLVLSILIYVWVTHNKLARLSVDVDEAFSTMDVYLSKRWELIPKVASVVKGYMKHESKTLTDLVASRKTEYDSMNNSQKVLINSNLNAQIGNIRVKAEDYPSLKADHVFQELLEQLAQVEEDIANARKYYNGTARLFNNRTVVFPSIIVAKIFGYKRYKMFEASTEARNDVEIDS